VNTDTDTERFTLLELVHAEALATIATATASSCARGRMMTFLSGPGQNWFAGPCDGADHRS